MDACLGVYQDVLDDGERQDRKVEAVEIGAPQVRGGCGDETQRDAAHYFRALT